MPPKTRGSSTQSKASSSSRFLQVPPPQSHRSWSRSCQKLCLCKPVLPAHLVLLTHRFRLAKLSPGEVEIWLWKRRTIRLFRIEPHAPKSDPEAQVNLMLRQYDHITQCSWPESWTSIVVGIYSLLLKMSQMPS